jgi:Putative Flp pilus-assembly TadE/G-like
MAPVNQKGQASIFVLALIGIVLVSTIFLYQSGRLTSEKMQLQNAADAAAFGASTLEARSLNFAAYTNRAMVANEVAVGQMVGMLSFVDELKTTGEYIDTYAGILEAATAWLFAIITVGDVIEGIISVIVEILEDIGSTITEVGEEAEQAMAVIASPVIRGLSIINSVYSISQTAYHGATIVLVTTNIFQSIEDNVPGTTPFNMINIFDPNKPGAHLSDLGVLALVGHLPSYWQGYTKRYTPSKQKKKKKSKEEKEKEKKEQELLSKYERQIKKDKERIAKDQKILGKDEEKYNADLKRVKADQKKIKTEQKKCAALKQIWEKNKTTENSDNYHACQQRLREDKLTLQTDNTTLQVDEQTRKEHRAKLKKDQATLARHQKQLSDEEAYEAEEEKEEKEKGKGGKEKNAGMQRMAATIRDARDPFSSGGPPVWDKDIYGMNYKFSNRDWKFGLGFDVNLHVGPFHFGHLAFFTGMDSKGGSELRYKGDNYGWSGLDTSVIEAQLTIMGFPIGLAIPTGGGGYQAASSSGSSEEEEGGLGNVLTVLDMPPTLGYYGQPKIYGEAGYPYDRWPSWEGAATELEENVIEGNPYSGLKPYRDMAEMDQKKSKYSMPFVSPFFLVGVVRTYKDINKTGPKFSDNLNLLTENPDIDRIGAIAKSELYFDRPTDLKYFLRHDQKTEKPNVFSPFWQARLSKTSDLDRFLAMAIQHKKIWLANHDAEKVPGLEALKKELEKILNLF